jgi:trimeric autotransporter adhesin
MFKYLSILTVAVLFFSSCSKKAADTPVATVPERLELAPASKTVLVGNTTSFTVSFFNNRGEPATVPTNITWTSLDNTIATVNAQGIITGIATGQTTIKVTYNNTISATALISVTSNTVPERLEISSSTNSILTGASTTFTLLYFNNTGNQAPVPSGVVWSSMNTSIATVNQQGVVMGVAVGQSTIKATLNTLSASATITVTGNQERLEISPGNLNIMVGNTAPFTLTYFNASGMQAPVPVGVVWNSVNASIATVNQQGMVTGMAVGLTTVTATLNTLNATASVTIAANNQLASIVLNPSTILEVNKSQFSTVTATGLNASGVAILGLTFNWASNNNSLVTVLSSGIVQGVEYGTANITATVGSITSPPLMVQVIRSGTFNGGSGSAGQAKLKIENGILKLQTSSSFSVSAGPPDLRIYLSNSTSSITNAVEIATLNQRSGAQSWNVPATNSSGQTITITSYQYVLVWCRQFGGNYGHVVLP